MNREALELKKKMIEEHFNSVSEEIKQKQHEQLRLQGEYRAVISIIDDLPSELPKDEASTIVVKPKKDVK